MARKENTKFMMASALKELLITKPLSKITVEDICKRCGMTRQSFYYHFVDKFDLVTWIFDEEYVKPNTHNHDLTDRKSIRRLCDYLYEERAYYRRVVEYHAQNSFLDYCKQLLQPLVREGISNLEEDEEEINFYTEFFSYAFIHAIGKWISDAEPIAPEIFVRRLYSCAKMIGTIAQ